MTDNLRDLLRFTDEQKQELRRRMMTDTLRDRIAAAVADEVTRQATRRNEYSFKYTPLDDEGNDLPELIGLDTSIDPAVVADAVIEALRLHRNDEEDEYGGYKPTGRYRYVTEWQADDE